MRSSSGWRAMFPDAGERFGARSCWFVIDRGDGRLGGYVEVGTRPYAEGCDSPGRVRRGVVRRRGPTAAGWGGELFAAVEVGARDGHTELASGSLLDNAASIAAHKALGFDEVERQVHFAKRL